MFRSRYFNQRSLSALYFDGAIPESTGTSAFFRARYFRPRYLAGQQMFQGVPPANEIAPVATSIAIEVLPSTVPRNTPVTIIAYVYDQFNKAMPNVRVDFNSTSPTVLSTPAHGFTDSMGRVVKVANTFASGTTNLYAAAGTLQAYTVVTVTLLSGGVTSSLTHGATIQVGNSGGGNPGPIRVKLTRRVRRWPTS